MKILPFLRNSQNLRASNREIPPQMRGHMSGIIGTTQTAPYGVVPFNNRIPTNTVGFSFRNPVTGE